MLGHAAQAAFGWFTQPVSAYILGIGPTLVVLALIAWLNWRRRRFNGVSTVAKAVGAIFSAVGIANVVMVAVVGVQAWRMQSIQVWLIYPCIVMAFQGAAWMAAATLRRRGWMALVATGWFATAIAMGVFIPNWAAYLTVLFASFILFMVAPGYAMMRTFRT